ncbi:MULTISPECIES: hypothetical protein [Vibrio]|nr:MULTISPECIES: hypothetical protein [Vibrio]EJE8558406.1 hypothetical protein [Vibrio vulnificus]EJG1716332.1 hypothetical protein [Vibrio parahaemolyticus]EKA7375001.1 hypothetical protein [Vibrio parahaemolyticus]ELA9377737.1 hypothetical protein [Vibrio parahaemolyticus]ELK8488072.1 hypothetical protein [Vibrio parahaemolyticus]
MSTLINIFPVLALLFVPLFSIWVAFTILEGTSSTILFKINACRFQKKVTSLLENPRFTEDGKEKPVEQTNIQAIAKKYNFTRNQILYVLENMYADATAAEGNSGQLLRKHEQSLGSLLEKYKETKSFDQLPNNIQEQLSLLKQHCQTHQSTFLALEDNILKLKHFENQEAKREKARSVISLVLGAIGIVVGLIPFLSAWLATF